MTTQDYKLPVDIKRAVIEVNGGCNYKCTMCPQATGREKEFLTKMNLNDFERIVKDAAQHGLEVVQLEGSGEATLNRNLPEYIEIVKRYNAKAQIYSNGYLMQGDFMKDCVDAGLDFFRFSVIGYNRETYLERMRTDAFDRVKQNAIDMIEYSKNKQTVVASYHLIMSNDVESELKQFQDNFIYPVGTKAEVWLLHNWAGSYDPSYQRTGKKRTCGRPFAPELTVRAGGLTIAPCCQTLGKDGISVLGSLKYRTIEEEWNNESYQWLREKHAKEQFDDISYCKDCDFLIEKEDVLVWTNGNTELNKMNNLSFTLK